MAAFICFAVIWLPAIRFAGWRCGCSGYRTAASRLAVSSLCSAAANLPGGSWVIGAQWGIEPWLASFLFAWFCCSSGGAVFCNSGGWREPSAVLQLASEF